MKLRPGCGCLVLILGILNLLITILVLYGFVAGVLAVTLLPVSLLLIFFANSVVCLMLGLAAVRRSGARDPGLPDREETSDGYEGADIDPDTEADR